MGYDVMQYGYMQYLGDPIEDGGCAGDLEMHTKRMSETIKQYDPFLLIWWNWSQITADAMKRIKHDHYERIFCAYNWDDPHCWIMPRDCLRYFDITFSSCWETLGRYAEFGVPMSRYLVPSFDPSIHYPDYNPDYECDVSFMCTNLYSAKDIDHDHRILVDRHSMVQALDADDRINFHLYGPERIRHAAPKSYRGEISYDTNRLAFYNSKVSINVHGAYGDGYLNERVFTILGSKGLLLTDKMKGMRRHLIADVDCVVMENGDPQAICDQVYDIITNYDRYEKIRENGHRKALNNYTYQHMGNTIIDGVREYQSKQKHLKNIDHIPLVMGINLDTVPRLEIDDLRELRHDIKNANPKSNVSWMFTHKSLNQDTHYVERLVQFVKSCVDLYEDTVGISFGFLTKESLEKMVVQIRYISDLFETHFAQRTPDPVWHNRYFYSVPEAYRPKSIMSYSISSEQMIWVKQNLGIRYFMGWTATQANVDGFTGVGSPLSPYYADVKCPIRPADSNENNSECLVLNTITVDPIGCRYTSGESRWTIHPADPLTHGESQVALMRRYLANPYCKSNRTNYFSLYMDSNWILTNWNIRRGWNAIMDFIKKAGIHIMSIDRYCSAYESQGLYCDRNGVNSGMDYKLGIRGLDFSKPHENEVYTSEYCDRYLWIEDRAKRIILKRRRKTNLHSMDIVRKGEVEYKIIDFTDYSQPHKNDTTINGCNYITGRNYKLTPDAPITPDEKRIVNEVLENLDRETDE